MSDYDPVNVNVDVLVIGGGLGGCRAALRARELGASVALVEKAQVARAGPMTYVHSQFAPDRLLEGDELNTWVEEFVVGSNYLADQDWTAMFLRDAYFRFRELIDMGVPYARSPDGNLKYVKVRGHKIGTTLGADGRACMEVMRKAMKRARVRLFEKVASLDLLTLDGLHPTKEGVCGAVGVHVQTGVPHVFRAKAVLLCTGPFYPRMHYAFADHIPGDGHRMAYRAGAELAGMEFGQFAAWSYFNKTFFTPGQAKIQGIGAHFKNRLGERFMSGYDPIWGEQTGLIQMARGIITENIEGRGPCYVDMRHVPTADIEMLYQVAPTVGRAFKEFGVDPARDTLTVNPMMVLASNSSSGLRIGLDGETNVPGLYAAGACTCLPHMMAGISGSAISSASLVTGYRAAGAMAARAASLGRLPRNTRQVDDAISAFYAPRHKFRLTRPADAHLEIGRVTGEATFALFKNAARIQHVREELARIEADLLPKVYAPDLHELVKAHDARTYLEVCKLVTSAMLERTESRAELFRADYPFRDNDRWLKWLMLSAPGEDLAAPPRVTHWDLPFERWPIKPPRGIEPSTYGVPERFREAQSA